MSEAQPSKLVSMYAPDRNHRWRILSNREIKDIPHMVEFEGKIFIAKNYAGQCWCYEVERVEKEKEN